MSTDAIAFALANMVGTVAFLSMRIGRVERKLDAVLSRHDDHREHIEHRLLTLEGRRVTR